MNHANMSSKKLAYDGVASNLCRSLETKKGLSHGDTMFKLLAILTLLVLVCLEVAHLASFRPVPAVVVLSQNLYEQNKVAQATTISKIDDYSLTTGDNSADHSTTQAYTTTTQPTTLTSTTTASTFQEPNIDQDDLPPSTPMIPMGVTIQNSNPNIPEKVSNPTTNKPFADNTQSKVIKKATVEPNIVLYSVFIVYVSIIKLIFHNVTIINYNFNEPGLLIIFGIIWELVARQMSSNYDIFPRFDSRIFFYLFLPSTVLDSASLLSNKWLFLNLFPILLHSVLGTVLFASGMGFTIYSLGKHNLFNLSVQQPALPIYDSNINPIVLNYVYNSTNSTAYLISQNSRDYSSILETNPIQDQPYQTNKEFSESHNLTLIDCLLFGTILSSIDSNTMLGIIKLFQLNDRLYYLVLGENLMNNAVVIMLFNLLLEFFNETRLTVVKIYIAILQFFVTLFSSIFIGLLLASFALIAVRLTKKFRVPSALTSFQNQYQAMVETLLILKLAYLAYTLASLAGTSRILSLATFGILQDQYIKHNLNLRSQLTFRQVILATKTLGNSLVYPLLGILLVEITSNSQFFQAWISSEAINSTNNGSRTNTVVGVLSAASLAASKLNQIANETNLYWNFKFLSLAMVLVIVYRFAVVILLSQVSNLFANSQMKIKFKEQVIVAYGGLKGPLGMALVHRLLEQEEYRDKTMRSKHMFMYTILIITFVSTVFFGSFIKPLVSKIEKTLYSQFTSSLPSARESIVFEHINERVIESISFGLNSILGHSKSSYDRFADINETQIKPWLTRSGSNINWLSVFYDNLILDETLNANCFYRSTNNSNNPHLPNRTATQVKRVNPIPIVRRRSSAQSLDTIDENRQLTRREPRVVNPKGKGKIRPQLSASDSFESRDLPGTSSDPRTNKQVNQSDGLPRSADSAVLKEFVMLNLKIEEAKERKEDFTNNWRCRATTPKPRSDTRLKYNRPRHEPR